MSRLFDPLLTPPPSFRAEEASSLLAKLYGSAGDLERLYGERDLNFMVTTNRGRFVLKFHNSADSASVVDMQTRALAHVAAVDPEVAVPSVVPGVDGKEWQPAVASDGRICLLQLLTFVEGRQPRLSDLAEGTLYDWGRMVARMGRAMRGFFHSAAAIPLAWDIQRTMDLQSRLATLDCEQREVIAAVLQRFEARVQPILAGLRSQVIHNDLTRENLRLDGCGDVIGVVDFGDMTHTSLVCDLAVALTNLLASSRDGLDVALPVIAGYQALTPLEPEEADLLGELVAARCAISVVLSASRRQLPGAEILQERTWPLLQQIHREGYDLVDKRFAVMCGNSHSMNRSVQAERSPSDLRQARLAVLGPAALSYERPVHLRRGEGVFLFTTDGEKLLDAYNNVPVVGHCHPEVVDAVTSQMRRLNSNTRYLQEAPIELAERLIASAPGQFDRVLLVNSGSEANDVAWRIACAATGSRGAVVTRFAYHGITHAVTSLSPAVWPNQWAPSNVRLVFPPGEKASASPSEKDRPAQGKPMDVKRAVGELVASGEGVAAMYVDCALSSDGIQRPPERWLREAVATVRARGGLFIADEVQAGFGRTGTDLWSIRSLGIEPDMMTIGKPMGNGFPVAAILTRAELVDSLLERQYFSSFGGNTVACVAALTVLRVIEEEQLVQNAHSVGQYLLAGLTELGSRYRSTGAARGWGLYAGLDVVDPEDRRPDALTASRVVNHMRRSGVLIGTTGSAANVLKIRPPLVFERQHVDFLLKSLDTALANVETP